MVRFTILKRKYFAAPNVRCWLRLRNSGADARPWIGPGVWRQIEVSPLKSKVSFRSLTPSMEFMITPSKHRELLCAKNSFAHDCHTYISKTNFDDCRHRRRSVDVCHGTLPRARQLRN